MKLSEMERIIIFFKTALGTIVSIYFKRNIRNVEGYILLK